VKWTLLEIVQSILSSLDSEEVNSISDTVESKQVAEVVKNCYNDIVSRANLPELFKLFELEPSNDLSKPTLMYKPEDIDYILWVKYDKREGEEKDLNFLPVTHLTPPHFLERMYNLKESQDNVRRFVHRIGDSSIDFLVKDNVAPTFFTSFDDNTVVFDSYDAMQDDTLKKNKSLCYGHRLTDFRMSDSFVAPLDARHFSLLLNESKALAFAELKQSIHASAERNARRGWVHLQKHKKTLPYVPGKAPNYGRK
jgi:hypothetical protein